MNPERGKRLSEDEIFGLLAAPRRRAVLRLLELAGGDATVEYLTDEVAIGEHGIDVDPGARKAVYVSLYQTHVPRLVEAGVLAYDEGTKTVSLTGPWRQLVAYLHFDPTARSDGLLARVFRRRTADTGK